MYRAWLDRAELAVQLRASFSGEASAAVGDCLAAGVPMIVTDVGWLGELPDDAAVRSPPTSPRPSSREACGRLLADPAARDAARQRRPCLRQGAHLRGRRTRLLEILDAPAAAAG